MRRSRPYSIIELNKMVEQYRGTQEQRVDEFGLKRHSDQSKKSTKTDWWDMPLTVCACASSKAPFGAANGRNCSALRNPHPVLLSAYDNIVDTTGQLLGKIAIGAKPGNNLLNVLGMNGEDSNIAGRCAEPHAANKLLNMATKQSASLNISDLRFSIALDSRYPVAKPYCATCRCVFPQLRLRHE